MNIKNAIDDYMIIFFDDVFIYSEFQAMIFLPVIFLRSRLYNDSNNQ